MKYGLEDEQVESIKRIISSFSAVEKVVIFGSRAKGKNRPGSDIDLALAGKMLTMEDILNVGVALESLSFPLKFDLINFDRISDSAIRNHIDRAGQIFYIRKENKEESESTK
jgi:uncharacterized protein